MGGIPRSRRQVVVQNQMQKVRARSRKRYRTSDHNRKQHNIQYHSIQDSNERRGNPMRNSSKCQCAMGSSRHRRDYNHSSRHRSNRFYRSPQHRSKRSGSSHGRNSQQCQDSRTSKGLS